MVFKNSLSIEKVGLLSFMLSIIFMPIDSFPYFPVDSVYRPLSIIFLMPAMILYFLKGRVSKVFPWVLFFSFAFFLHSLVTTELLFSKNEHLFKTAVTLCLFFVLVTTLFTIFNDGIKDKDAFLHCIGLASFASLVLMLIVAFIQILMKLGILPVTLSDHVTYFFSYRSSQRVQSVSGEPSQMVRSLILLMLLVCYFYTGKFKKIALISAFFVLAFSGSTYGYLTIILMVFFYFLFFKFSYFFNVKFLLFFSLFCFVFFLFRNEVLDTYTNKKIDAVYSIFSTLDLNVLNAILQRDGSIFQRVINPVIGFMSGSYSNYLGVGLDGYRYIYPEIIINNFPYAMNYSTVKSAVLGVDYITPKSLYSKIFSELGVSVFLIFVLYYLWLYLRIKQRCSKVGFPQLMFVYVLVLPLNTDSIVYFNYFFSLIILHVWIEKINLKKEAL